MQSNPENLALCQYLLTPLIRLNNNQHNSKKRFIHYKRNTLSLLNKRNLDLNLSAISTFSIYYKFINHKKHSENIYIALNITYFDFNWVFQFIKILLSR